MHASKNLLTVRFRDLEVVFSSKAWFVICGAVDWARERNWRHARHGLSCRLGSPNRRVSCIRSTA